MPGPSPIDLANENAALRARNAELEAAQAERDTDRTFGFIWEQQPEEALDVCATHIPVLRADPSRAIDVSGGLDRAPHIFIEGENLHALIALAASHAGKVDVIYIDPPYNTGNRDFRYGDRYVDSRDTHRHSKYMSFLQPRLKVAQTLLAQTGVIFVSIGTDEQAHLKMLMDQTFGEANFVACITRVTKKGSNKGKHVAPSLDYVLVYAKSIKHLPQFTAVPPESYIKTFNKTDDDGRAYLEKGLYQASLDSRPNQRYYIECPDGSFCIPPGDVFPDDIYAGSKVTPVSKTEDKIWRWAVPSYFANRDGLIFKQTKKSPLLDEHGQRSKYNVYVKQYLDESLEGGIRPRDFLDDFPNAQGKADLKALGMGGSFEFPKPVGLIRYLLQIIENPDALVLDFFAGSGTTAQAVLEQNAADGGHRQFIVCTNNENNIARQVTHRRIANVVEKLGGDVVSAKALRYFCVDLVEKTASSYTTNQRLRNRAEEMVRLAENAFVDVELTDEYGIYRDAAGHYTGLLYDEDAVGDFCAALDTHASHFTASVYTFSLTDDDLASDYADLPFVTDTYAVPATAVRAAKRMSAVILDR